METTQEIEQQPEQIEIVKKKVGRPRKNPEKTLTEH